jgi:AraC-like DNA-binding protein
MHLKMSAAWVDQWVPDVRKLYGRPIVPDSGWGAALAAYMRQLSPEAVAASPLPKSLMLDQLGGLLTLAATDLTDVRPLLSRSSRQLRGRIHDSVKQQCASTALTALDVARALGISVRTLHRCLAANGETFGEVLIGARTDLALRMLASRAFDSLTNAEIARRAGFSDPSHFARTVHRHTGRTPTQFRKEGR